MYDLQSLRNRFYPLYSATQTLLNRRRCNIVKMLAQIEDLAADEAFISEGKPRIGPDVRHNLGSI